jgi:tetratricopeptide (TPR) repeat protein
MAEQLRAGTGKKSNVLFWTLAVAALALTLFLAGLRASHFFRSPPSPDEGNAHWRKAQEAIAAREFPEAAARLTHCLEIWPLNAQAHFLMARTSRRAGQFTLWKKHLDRAELLHWPKDQIDLERKLRRAQVGDVWEVEDFLIDRLNKRPPEEVIILEALVNGFLQNDRLIDVLFFTSTWSSRFPKDWLPLIYHGNAGLRLNGKASDAIKDFERVLELKPDHPEAHFSLAIVLTDQGEFQKAVPHFQFCLDSQIDDPTGALFGLASCQFSLGETDQARATLGRLFAQAKDHARACFLQAKIELADDRPQEAFHLLQKADALSANESDITNALLQVSRQLVRPLDMTRYRRRLEDIHQRDAELDQLLSDVRDQPDDPDRRLHLAMICLKLGRHQEAAHWFQGILWKDPGHLPTLNAIVDFYQSEGNRKMADLYRRKAQKPSGQDIRKAPESARK